MSTRRFDPRTAALFALLVAANVLVALLARSTSFGESVAYPLVSLVLLVAMGVVGYRLLRALYRDRA